MSTQQPIPTVTKIDFAPLHRSTEMENIHEQVTQNDFVQQTDSIALKRKTLAKHLTVIGDGSDIDNQRTRT